MPMLPVLQRTRYSSGLVVAGAVIIAAAGAGLGEDATDKAKPAPRIFIPVTFRTNDKLEGGIIAIDPETGKWKKIADEGGQVRVSPDRQTLLFEKNGGIWNCDTQGSNNPGRIFDRGYSSVWSPDDRQIIVTEGKHLEAQNKWQVENWLMKADGSNATPLPTHAEDHVHDWSPDGKWLLTVSDRDRIRIKRPRYILYGYQIYLMQLDGRQQRRLTKDGVNLQPRFSSDGRKILYTHLQPERSEHGLWIMEADGKNPRE